jgi:Effector-associated domain 4/NACHT domain
MLICAVPEPPAAPRFKFVYPRLPVPHYCSLRPVPMPRPNYGNAVKQRATQFFTVLLDYANDELDCEERQLEHLQRDIQLHWQTEKRCAIRTKVRYLENLSRLGGSPLTSEHIKESIKCLTDFLEIIVDNRASKGGSETWHFTLNLWHGRFDRAANLYRFDLEWDRRKSPQPQTPTEPNQPTTDAWWELVRSSLDAQQYHRLTTNPLMGQERLKFSLDEVYVSLGSIERQPMTIFEVPDGIDDRSEEIGVNIIPDPDRLLARLLTHPAPNRIGIIGEPGSGKTTCLQRLATGLLDRQLLPIWISLADLQGKTLEDYLLEDWLKIATRQIAIDPKLQQDFAAQFAGGRVWLLLDAVDEMAIDASRSLTDLERQLRGWIGGAHIILTCRSNVWDSGKNALENFTTYRNLSLSNGYNGSPNLIAEFIQKWFKDRSELGQNLAIELAQPQYQRLRDAIKNPLRLALLCRYWSFAQGKLPSTKASLYQQFTDTIYEWKQDRFPTSLAQRQQLNNALGKLALHSLGLDASEDRKRERFRFRLDHHTVLELLEPDLLELSLQLGWLDLVGISAMTGAKIYAFYHPTFQEYFTARSITDWQYFFAGDTVNQPPIFNPYWQETILFWFGRKDVDSSEKEACLQALMNFDRERGGFYYYRAYFLAAAAIAEFPESIYSQEIIDRLLAWRFATFIPEQNIWQFYPQPIQDGARIALRHTDRVAAILGLERFVRSVTNPFLCWQAAHSLGKVFDPGNAIAIQSLVNALDRIHHSDLHIKICESLIRIDPDRSPIAISTLVEIVQTEKIGSLIRKAAFVLGKLSLEYPQEIDRDGSLLMLAIDTLVMIIVADRDAPTQKLSQSPNQLAAIDNLRQISPIHPVAQQQFVSDRTLPSSTRTRRKKVAHQRDVSIAIAELEQKLLKIDNAESQRRYAYQLGKFQAGHPLAVDTLLRLMSAPQPKSFYKRTGEYLKEVVLNEQLPLIITQLQHQVISCEQGDRSASVLECYKLVWYCTEQLPYQKFSQIWDCG